MSVPLDLVAWLVQERYIISLFHAIRHNWLLTKHFISTKLGLPQGSDAYESLPPKFIILWDLMKLRQIQCNNLWFHIL